MNKKLILRMMGRTLLLLAACLLFPLLVSVYYGEDPRPFALTILIVTALSIPLAGTKTDAPFFDQEGFVIVALIWLCFCLFGALPFQFSGHFSSFIDCLFEITSGFTTTGASILTEVESLPRGILFWRSFSSWLGGMGVLIFALALLPKTGERTQSLVRAESPGPVTNKLVPRTSKASKILYTIYIVLTVLEVICLRLAGMPFFDSVVHSFATICTGGYSIRNLSIGAYGSASIEIIVIIFMLLSALNFTVFFLMVTRRFAAILKSDELRFFLFIVAAAITLIVLNLLLSSAASSQNFGDLLRQVTFQVASVVTTTGFATADFNLWPQFSHIILILLMIIGGCSGSTAGGIKVSRALLLARCIRRDLRKIAHPRAVKVVQLDGKAVDPTSLDRVLTFFSCYAFILAISCLLLSLDNFSFLTTTSAVFSCLGNVGPGLDVVGPMGNYAGFSGLSKVLLTFCMLVGRLEIFPILMLFAPATWKRV